MCFAFFVVFHESLELVLNHLNVLTPVAKLCIAKMASRVSNEQLEMLLDHLQSHPALAKGFGLGGRSRETVERLWNELAANLNALGSGTNKSGANWKRVSCIIKPILLIMIGTPCECSVYKQKHNILFVSFSIGLISSTKPRARLLCCVGIKVELVVALAK